MKQDAGLGESLGSSCVLSGAVKEKSVQEIKIIVLLFGIHLLKAWGAIDPGGSLPASSRILTPSSFPSATPFPPYCFSFLTLYLYQGPLVSYMVAWHPSSLQLTGQHRRLCNSYCPIMGLLGRQWLFGELGKIENVFCWLMSHSLLVVHIYEEQGVLAPLVVLLAQILSCSFPHALWLLFFFAYRQVGR